MAYPGKSDGPVKVLHRIWYFYDVLGTADEEALAAARGELRLEKTANLVMRLVRGHPELRVSPMRRPRGARGTPSPSLALPPLAWDDPEVGRGATLRMSPK